MLSGRLKVVCVVVLLLCLVLPIAAHFYLMAYEAASRESLTNGLSDMHVFVCVCLSDTHLFVCVCVCLIRICLSDTHLFACLFLPDTYLFVCVCVCLCV